MENKMHRPEGEIVVYQPDEITRLEVMVENETVWLNRHQLALLFDRDIKTIGKHINNALNEELSGLEVVANFATTASDGKTYFVEHYNLEMMVENETVWLTQAHLAQLFGVNQPAISKHIRNIYSSGELSPEDTYSILEYMGNDGK